MKESTKAFITEEVERVIAEKNVYITLPVHGMLINGVGMGVAAFATYKVLKVRENRKARKNKKFGK